MKRLCGAVFLSHTAAGRTIQSQRKRQPNGNRTATERTNGLFDGNGNQSRGRDMTTLTTRKLAALKPGKWASDGGPRGAGALVARKLLHGATIFYFRYTAPSGQRHVIPLGEYGGHALTLERARASAAKLSIRYRSGDRDLRVALEAEQSAKQANQADKRTRTLGALLEAYADQLVRSGKSSARSVRAELRHHVRDAWHKLWAAPLEDVTADDLLAIVAEPANAGKLRQAEKVRAYLRAAFAAGMKARHNANALPALRALRITANPAASLTPIEGANRARNRALSLAELRAYWQRIQAPEHGALRFHLLTGCQRIRQLARATEASFDVDTGSLRLLDYKGRRSEARQHHVPLLPDAIDAMRDMHAGVDGPHLFTLTAGESGADYSGVSKRIRKVAEAMSANGELPGGFFTPGDLRRTVETRLADAGISRDARARLQSHGLGGVQERHYDRHDYLLETRRALEVLHRLLTDTGANIVPIIKIA